MFGEFSRVLWNCEIFHDRLGLGLRDDVAALTFYGFQVAGWHLVGLCTVTWSRSLFEMAMLDQFCAFHGTLKFSMIGRKMTLGKSVSLKFGGMMQFTIKRITVWNGHTQLIFAFSDLGRTRVLSFSERLVLTGIEVRAWLYVEIITYQCPYPNYG